jgi:hypothetical protein
MSNAINRNSSTLLMSAEDDRQLAFIEHYEDSDSKPVPEFIRHFDSARAHYKPDKQNYEDLTYMRKSDSFMRLYKSRASREYNEAEIFGDDPLFNHSNTNSAMK